MNKVGRKANVVYNKYRDFYVETWLLRDDIAKYPQWIEDAIIPPVRLDWGGNEKDLSAKKIMTIICVFEWVTAEGVAQLLNMKVRAARNYVKACEVALQRLEPKAQALGADHYQRTGFINKELEELK